MIDTHCHLYSSELSKSQNDILERATQAGVTQILLPAIDSESHKLLLDCCKNSTPNLQITPMMGLHPCSVNENVEEELAKAKSFLENGQKYCAVGEIGLDFHWDLNFVKEQKYAFETQIDWAIEKNLPIAIHARKATYDCIEILKKRKGKVKGVFHCFSGSAEEAKEIIQLGFLLGIGGVVTYKNAGLKELLVHIDLAHLILETDAPYLAPVPFRGKTNEPSFVQFVAKEIAQIKNISFENVVEKTTENAQKLFNL